MLIPVSHQYTWQGGTPYNGFAAAMQRWPAVEAAFRRYQAYCQTVFKKPSWPPPGGAWMSSVEHTEVFGRWYDVAAISAWVDFRDKEVAEFGAAGSALGSFVSDVARRVVVSDLFDLKWGLGDLAAWRRVWTESAWRPEAMVCEQADMSALPYADASFDVVLTISAIEHARDDVACAREIGRVLRPGGVAVIGTDFGSVFDPSPHSRLYTPAEIDSRLVRPSGLHYWGDVDLAWQGGFAGLNHNAGLVFLRKAE